MRVSSASSVVCPDADPGPVLFTFTCFTRHVHVTFVASRHARLDVLLDGVRITRTNADAARRHCNPVSFLSWDDLEGASLHVTRKGNVVVRVTVTGATWVSGHRNDPYAVKVNADQAEAAAVLVDRITTELDTRRRWRELSGTAGPSTGDLITPG